MPRTFLDTYSVYTFPTTMGEAYMNPCDLCKERKLTYPGVCDDCRDERRATAEREWRPSYDAATSRLDGTSTTPQVTTDPITRLERWKKRERHSS